MQQKVILLMTLMTALMITSLLTACSSVPISTILKLSHSDEQNLITMKPTSIRAKITLNNFIDSDLIKTKLGLNLENEQGKLALQFPLEKLNWIENNSFSPHHQPVTPTYYNYNPTQ